MTPVKRFLIGYAAVYVAVAVILNVTLGPPGLSKEYLENYKDDHDRYIGITKNEGYKRLLQNPEAGAGDEALAEAAAFAAEYEARESFIAEDERRALYQILFDTFNVLMLIVLFVRFGRRPFVEFLDAGVEEVRKRIDEVEKARKEAQERRADAQRKVDVLGEEEAQLEAEAEIHMREMHRSSEESLSHSLALLQQETEDRIRQERLAAERAMKEELIEAAMTKFAERYKAEQSAEGEAALIDRFMKQLESSK